MRKTAMILALLLVLSLAPAAQAADVKGEVGFAYYYYTDSTGPLSGHYDPAHYMLDFSGTYSKEISYLLQLHSYSSAGKDKYAIVYRPSSLAMEFTLGQNYYQRDKFAILDNGGTYGSSSEDINNFSETGIVITPTGFGDNFTASVYLDTANSTTDIADLLSRVTADYKAGFGDLSLGVHFVPKDFFTSSYTAYSFQAAVPLKTSTPVTALAGISGTDQDNTDPVYNLGIKTTYSEAKFSLEYSSLNSQIGIGAGKTLSSGLDGSIKYVSFENPVTDSRESELLTEVTLKF